MSKQSPIEIEQQHITAPGKMTLLNVFGVTKIFNEEIKLEHLLEAGGVYRVTVFMDELALEKIEGLQLPKKVYDFDQPFRAQVLKTLRTVDANNNIGVLLEGYKGMGKSVTAKLLAIESGLPIIVVENPITKDQNLSKFFNSIRQDHVLFIDEFEKLFEEKDDKESPFHSQQSFLTFMDGVTNTKNKRLAIFTTNKEIDDKFHDRPSRIRYHRKYNFMPDEVWKAILVDRLLNKTFEEDLIENLDIKKCTIDILMSIIDEINIHQKPYSAFKEFFNYRDKEYIYNKYILEESGDWKWLVDDSVVLDKEIGFNEDYFKRHVPGVYNCRVLDINEKQVIYEIKSRRCEYDDNDNEIPSTVKIVKLVYKLSKSSLNDKLDRNQEKLFAL